MSTLLSVSLPEIPPIILRYGCPQEPMKEKLEGYTVINTARKHVYRLSVKAEQMY